MEKSPIHIKVITRAMGSRAATTMPVRNPSVVSMTAITIRIACPRFDMKFWILSSTSPGRNDKYSVLIPNSCANAFQSLENLEDLILGNQKFKYLKLSKSLDISRSEKLKNEKSTDVLKTNISDLENENKKLKKTVNKMLLNYENKIQQLEERNKILEDKFQKAYDMLPKYKKKDFEKE